MREKCSNMENVKWHRPNRASFQGLQILQSSKIPNFDRVNCPTLDSGLSLSSVLTLTDERVEVRPDDRSLPIGTSPRKGSGTLTREGPGMLTFIARRLFR